MYNMEVMKKHVDNFLPGRRIPKCLLSAVAEEKKIRLHYQVKLIGAKEPFNMMVIEFPPVSGTQSYVVIISLTVTMVCIIGFNHRGDRKRFREQSSGDMLETGMRRDKISCKII